MPDPEQLAEAYGVAFTLPVQVPAWPEERQNAFVRDLYHWLERWPEEHPVASPTTEDDANTVSPDG